MDMVLGRTGSFWRKGLFAAILVVLADVLLYNGNGGSALGLYMAAWALLSFATNKAGWSKPWSLIAFAMAAAFAGALFYDPSFLGVMLFLITLGVAIMLPQIEGAGDGWYWTKRLMFHGIFSSISPLLDLNRLQKAKKRSPSSPGLGRILPILVLPTIGTLLFLGLFAMANPVISDFLSNIELMGFDGLDIVRLFFWGIIFIGVWSTMRPWKMGAQFKQLGDSQPTRIAGVSIASVTLSLIMFNLLFGLQNGLDLIYLWGDAKLPEQFTLAEYAHRGAYPLVVTALLAGLFIIVTTHPKSELAGNKAIRWLVILWIAQNLLLLSSTVERTLLYIDGYSLTRFRIAALIWMGLVGVGLVLVTWRMLRGNSLAWLVNGNMLAGFAVLATCSFVDLGSVAAHWNVTHARDVEGDGARLDLCYLNNLNGSGLLALGRLDQRTDLYPGFKQRVTLVRQTVQNRIAHNQQDNRNWRWRDAQRLAELKTYGLKDLRVPETHYVACDGTLLPIGERWNDEADYERY
jgi:Domain of unknown function (DUF4173)